MRTLRTTMFVTLALLGSLLAGSTVSAGEMAITEEELAIFRNEPPIAQADVDEYLRLLPDIMAVAADPAAAEKVIAGSKLSKERFGVVSVKIGLGMPIAMQGDAANADEFLKQFPKEVHPSKAEIELLKTNLPKIMQAMMAMQAAPAK